MPRAVTLWDWSKYASSLPPIQPKRFATNQLSPLQQQEVTKALFFTPVIDQIASAEKDEDNYQEEYKSYSGWYGEFQQTKNWPREF